MTRQPGDRRPVTIKEAYLNIKKPLDLTPEGIFTNEEQAPLIVRLTGGDEMSPSEALEFLNDNIGLGEFPELMEALYSEIENKKLMQAHGYDGIISSFGRDERDRRSRSTSPSIQAKSRLFHRPREAKMPYVVVKNINGRQYRYEQETYREGDKVRTRSTYIGPVDGGRRKKGADWLSARAG